MPSRSAPSARSRFTFAPVAISALPKRTSSFVDSFTTRSAGSSFITLTRVPSSTSFSSHHPAGFQSAASRSAFPARYSFDSGGRSYGGSASRPTIRIEPPAPSSRSVAAQLAAATPPPISRKSTSRSAMRGSGGARLARWLEHRRDLVLEPGVEHEQHLVALLDDRVGERDEPGAVAEDRDHERALGDAEVAH